MRCLVFVHVNRHLKEKKNEPEQKATEENVRLRFHFNITATVQKAAKKIFFFVLSFSSHSELKRNNKKIAFAPTAIEFLDEKDTPQNENLPI